MNLKRRYKYLFKKDYSFLTEMEVNIIDMRIGKRNGFIIPFREIGLKNNLSYGRARRIFIKSVAKI